MKEIVIHSGMPKTGSSALQVFFAKNRDKLIKSSIDYFDMGDIELARKEAISSGNGAILSRSLLNSNHEAHHDDKGNVIWDEFIGKVKNSKCDIGLLSSEFFTNIPNPSIEKLKSALNELGINLKYIFFVRRQDQFLMSAYMQRVKRHGFTGTPESFIKDMYKKVGFLNYFGYTNGLSKVLGKENVVPRIYENSKNHRAGLIGDFIENVLGECPDWIENSQTINVSPSPLEIKMMLLMNKYSPRYKFSDYLIEDSIVAGRAKEYQNHSIVKPSLVREILEHFSEQNMKFCKAFVKGEGFDDKVNDNYIDLDKLQFSSSEMMDVVSGFLVRFDKRILALENKLN